MSKFIKFSDKSGNVVYVNPERVVMVETEYNLTAIRLGVSQASGLRTVYVKDSLEETVSRLQG